MEKQEKTTWQFLKGAWPFFRPYKRDLIGTGIWTVAMQLLALVEPYLLMLIIDKINRREFTEIRQVIPLAVGALVLLIVTTGVKVLKDRRIRNATSLMEAELPSYVLNKLLRLPLAYHHGTNAGQHMSLVQDGVGRVKDIVWLLFFEVLPVAVQTIIVAVTLLVMNASIAGLVITAVAVAWLVLLTVKRRTRDIRVRRMERRREWSRIFSEFVTNVMTVLAFNGERGAATKVSAVGKEFRQLTLQEFSAYDRWQMGRNSLINLVRVGVITLCAWFVFQHVLSIGEIVFISMLVERLFSANFQLSGTYDRLVETVEPVNALIDIMQEKETVRDPEKPLEIPPGRVTISLTSATYAYPSRLDQPALTDLHLKILPGTMVGIVGESGHGKSTLARLLMRFYDPTSGFLALNGIDYRSLRLADIRRLIAYVPQEVELLDDTIEANIRYGRPNATDDEIAYAAKLARADVFIRKTKDGMQTLIGDRGLRLSGGERQRIGIARAILTGAPVLLFDEATSSVDADTIHEIKRAMAELRKERTLIVITHQLSTVQDADLIVVLKDGAISGMGTHSELVRSNDTYRGFVRLQQNAEASLVVQGDPRNIS